MITVYGASGHAKVVIDIIKSNNGTITQVLDDNDEITSIMDYKVIKPANGHYNNLVIAIGDNKTRQCIAQKLSAKFCKPLIHKSSEVGSDVKIGNGTVIMANTVINASVTIGTHCILNSGSIVEHDVRIDDFAHISPGAIITGGVAIGEGSHIGAGATILPNIKIGKNVIVGAGAIVLKDVEDDVTVIGNPAKVLKKNTN